MPAFLLDCYRYMEVGPSFISGAEKERLIEVSADGVVQCMDSNCTNTHTHAKIIIENKYPYLTDNVLHEPYSYVPQRHVPQIMSELAAYKASELWLVCFTVAAVSIIIICTFDLSLWAHIMLIVEDLFGGDKVRPPNKLHPLIKGLKEKISVYTSKKCQLLVEVPSF